MFFAYATQKNKKTQCFFILLEPVGIPIPSLINVTELCVTDFFFKGRALPGRRLGQTKCVLKQPAKLFKIPGGPGSADKPNRG